MSIIVWQSMVTQLVAVLVTDGVIVIWTTTGPVVEDAFGNTPVTTTVSVWPLCVITTLLHSLHEVFHLLESISSVIW